ncbi:MAG TPA: hypothetical protein VHN55_07085 [Sphingomicrobium sp.]|nr:hypothetical protein [Sphingomicrobium sp.]
MTFDGEPIFVGLVCLVLAVLVALRMVRGLSTGRLPVYRTHLERGEGEAKFFALFAVQGILFLLMAFIAADLLLGLGFRD